MTGQIQTPLLAAWYSAARPRTLTATYAPLSLAAVIALQQGVFDLIPFLLALAGALLLQIGANLVNEYADFRRGADEHKQAGQGMTIKNAVLSPRDVLNRRNCDGGGRRVNRPRFCWYTAARCCCGSVLVVFWWL